MEDVTDVLLRSLILLSGVNSPVRECHDYDPGSHNRHNPPFPFKQKVSEVIIHPMIRKV